MRGVMKPEMALSASAELGQVIIEDIVVNVSAKIKELDAKADGIYKEVDFAPEAILLM